VGVTANKKLESAIKNSITANKKFESANKRRELQIKS